MSDDRERELKRDEGVDAEFDEEHIEAPVTSREVTSAKTELAARCKSAGIILEEGTKTDDAPLRLGMKCGRDSRWLFLGSDESIVRLLSIPFERFVFLEDYEAICSYQDGFIEATVRANGVRFVPSSFPFRRLFGGDARSAHFDLDSVRLVVEPPQDGLPRIELSPASEMFTKLVRAPVRVRLTLKLTGCRVATHDEALALLKKTADSAFFQIDLLSDVAIMLNRERRRSAVASKPPKRVNLATDLQYPRTEFDDAPLSLYWYARSAFGMPLLQVPGVLSSHRILFSNIF